MNKKEYIKPEISELSAAVGTQTSNKGTEMNEGNMRDANMLTSS